MTGSHPTAGTARSAGEAAEREAAAMRRAMPLQRLIGNGMDYADAHELHLRSTAVEPWTAICEDIGDRRRERAATAAARSLTATARDNYLFASAAFRFGQVPLPDSDERKHRLYRDLIACYAAAADLVGGIERVEIKRPGGYLAGWLHLPDGVATPPVVIVAGGFDGWREEYDRGARALVERGMAVLLTDGPGQGESRLFGGQFFPPEPAGLDDAWRSVVDRLSARGDLGPIGVWGNSMGGYLAARLAGKDARIQAVCVNGGSDHPSEILDRYPRFIAKIQALYGVDDPGTAAALIRRHRLTPDDLHAIRCPALLLHGDPDQVFLLDSAERIHSGISSPDRTFLRWADGDHCIYNHTADKHFAVGDWFAQRLHS
ncbi:alpha/beta hydrolase family protein [Streptomyces mirabilis]|uniref:alpha/beta hydrolase family protein n=1 Tax=Streptomyces mirabilis TaxID=68239 RepID=UPI0036764894